ncbi:MAG: hypothetical protein LBU62_11420 [Bacteroidales bacterium]|jgi:hypothetical protein|nr:hypothetical protein [Bacteroidales bacterium]
MRNILLFVIIFASCTGTVRERYEYYPSGKVKNIVRYTDPQDTTKITVEHYFENGQLQVNTHFEDGERNGLYQEYLEDGTLFHLGNFKKGMMHGCFYEYAEDGRLETEDFYFLDKLVLVNFVQYFGFTRTRFNFCAPATDNKDTLIFQGQITFNQHHKIIAKESHFYHISSIDTVKHQVVLKFLNKEPDMNWKVDHLYADNGTNVNVDIETESDSICISYPPSAAILYGTSFLTKNDTIKSYSVFIPVTPAKTKTQW